jgi:hypothetical protein
MKEKIKKQNLNNEFYTSEKCFIIELSNSPDDPEVSIARARVEPGYFTPSLNPIPTSAPKTALVP